VGKPAGQQIESTVNAAREHRMSLPANLGPRNGILSLTIKDKSVLYAAYMPFIKHGGLFIPTNKSYKLGDEVFMLLNLMDEPEKIPVAALKSDRPPHTM